MALVDKVKYNGPGYAKHREFWAGRRAFLEGTCFAERTNAKSSSAQQVICISRELPSLKQWAIDEYSRLEIVTACVAIMIRKLSSDRFIVIDIPADVNASKIRRVNVPVCFDVNPDLTIAEFLQLSNSAFNNSRQYADFAFSALFGDDQVFKTNVCVTDRNLEKDKYDFSVVLDEQHLVFQFDPSKFGQAGAGHIADALAMIIETTPHNAVLRSE